jgi:hypothetical protein
MNEERCAIQEECAKYGILIRIQSGFLRFTGPLRLSDDGGRQLKNKKSDVPVGFWHSANGAHKPIIHFGCQSGDDRSFSTDWK